MAEQATQNSAVQNTDATTGSVSANVATIAGQQVIAQQLLDQSPVNMDDVLLADLAADYAIKLDTFVISNNATNKVGLLSVSGNAVTYTDASPTVGELWAKIADAIQQIHTNRLMPPDKIFMHPRRWAWFTAALDTAGRPLIGANNAQNAIGNSGAPTSQGWVANIQGLDVYIDPNIPINLGAGTNEDRIIVLRSTDTILYEDRPGRRRSGRRRPTSSACCCGSTTTRRCTPPGCPSRCRSSPVPAWPPRRSGRCLTGSRSGRFVTAVGTSSRSRPPTRP